MELRAADAPWWAVPSAPRLGAAPLPPPVGVVAARGEYALAEEVLITDWSASLDATYVPLVAAVLESGLPLRICGRGDDARTAEARASLVAAGIDPERADWLSCPADTIWIRDYGPFYLEDERGERAWGDATYAFPRPLDDDVPLWIAAWDGGRPHRVPLALEGGNLLVDGDGACVTTTQTTERAAMTADELGRLLGVYLGCAQTIVLEPLVGEWTGHADLFVLVTGPRSALVGSYDVAIDPVNAAVLDRDAAALEAAGFVIGRAPMPGHFDGDGDGVEDWRTHLNAVPLRAEGGVTVLMPAFADDRSVEAEASAAIAAAFPGARVVPVEAGPVTALGGALHCVTQVPPRLVPSAPAPTGCRSGGAPSGAVWLGLVLAWLRRPR